MTNATRGSDGDFPGSFHLLHEADLALAFLQAALLEIGDRQLLAGLDEVRSRLQGGLERPGGEVEIPVSGEKQTQIKIDIGMICLQPPGLDQKGFCLCELFAVKRSQPQGIEQV